MSAVPASAKKPRVVGLDLLKGTMLVKLTLTHLAICFASSYLHVAAFGGMWTFTVLIFCFGLGVGLSSKGGNAKMLALLAITYVVTALISSSPDPHGWSPAFRLLTFRSGEFNGRYLFPYMAYSALRLATNGKLTKINPYLLFGAAIAMHIVGRYLAITAPEAPGSAFWAACGPLTHAPLFVGGLLLARHLSTIASFFAEKGRLVGLVLLSLVAFVIAHFAKAGVKDPSLGSTFFIFFAATVGLLEILWLDQLARRMPSKGVDILQHLGRNSIQTLVAGLVLFNFFNLTRLHALTGISATVVGLSSFGMVVILLTQPIRIPSLTPALFRLRRTWAHAMGAHQERTAIERLLSSPSVWN